MIFATCSLRRAYGACAMLLLAAAPASAQVALGALDSAYTQNFNALPASGSSSWSNNTTLAGWYHARTGTGSNVVADSGATNAGNLYSYGASGANERALGSDAIRVLLIYRSGALAPVGSALADLNSIHNRPPTAQTFDVIDAANPARGPAIQRDRQPFQVQGLRFGQRQRRRRRSGLLCGAPHPAGRAPAELDRCDGDPRRQ